MQRSYNAADVPFKTLRALGGAVKEALLPDAGVENASMHEGDLLNLLHSSIVIQFNSSCYVVCHTR